MSLFKKHINTNLSIVVLLLAGCNFPLLDYEQSIVLGNLEGMKVRRHDVVLNSQFQKEESFICDLDNEGDEDLLIKSVWSHSVGGGDGSYILFETLNTKFELRGKMDFDTSYFRLEITKDTFNNGDSIITNYLAYTTCKREGPEDEARIYDDLPKFSLIPGDSDELIDAETEFHNENYQLRNWGKSSISGPVNQVGLNEYSKRIDFYDDLCDDFPINESIYIVFRVKLRGVFRFGWLEVVYGGSNEITILRSGIQD